MGSIAWWCGTWRAPRRRCGRGWGRCLGSFYAFDIVPDYASAWADFLKEDNYSAKEMFVRELPRLEEILRNLGDAKWTEIAGDEIAMGDYATASGQCERAMDLARNADDLRGQIQVMLRLVQIKLKEGRYQEAEEVMQRASVLARRVGDKTLEGHAEQWSRLVAWFIEDHRKATQS